MAERASTHYYHVKRWTAFPEGVEPGDQELRRDREDNMTRIARLIENRLLDICPALFPTCKMMPLAGRPQLVFEMTVHGEDQPAAEERAAYYIRRALEVQLGERYNKRKVRLEPVWGEWQTQQAADA